MDNNNKEFDAKTIIEEIKNSEYGKELSEQELASLNELVGGYDTELTLNSQTPTLTVSIFYRGFKPEKGSGSGSHNMTPGAILVKGVLHINKDERLKRSINTMDIHIQPPHVIIAKLYDRINPNNLLGLFSGVDTFETVTGDAKIDFTWES